jgi:hypothetical protein
MAALWCRRGCGAVCAALFAVALALLARPGLLLPLTTRLDALPRNPPWAAARWRAGEHAQQTFNQWYYAMVTDAHTGITYSVAIGGFRSKGATAFVKAFVPPAVEGDSGTTSLLARTEVPFARLAHAGGVDVSFDGGGADGGDFASFRAIDDARLAFALRIGDSAVDLTFTRVYGVAGPGTTLAPHGGSSKQETCLVANLPFSYAALADGIITLAPPAAAPPQQHSGGGNVSSGGSDAGAPAATAPPHVVHVSSRGPRFRAYVETTWGCTFPHAPVDDDDDNEEGSRGGSDGGGGGTLYNHELSVQYPWRWMWWVAPAPPQAPAAAGGGGAAPAVEAGVDASTGTPTLTVVTSSSATGAGAVGSRTVGAAAAAAHPGLLTGEVGLVLSNARIALPLGRVRVPRALGSGGAGVLKLHLDVGATFAYLDFPHGRVAAGNVTASDASRVLPLPLVLGATAPGPGSDSSAGGAHEPLLGLWMELGDWAPFADAHGATRLPMTQRLRLVTPSWDVTATYTSHASQFVRIAVPYHDEHDGGRHRVVSDFRASFSGARLRVLHTPPQAGGSGAAGSQQPQQLYFDGVTAHNAVEFAFHAPFVDEPPPPDAAAAVVDAGA